ncbi:MAG: exodeoxyribonuclease III [Synergistaceae bacterium]|nr:exodeoxyribonuclease III [Synergistaceae bacterium]
MLVATFNVNSVRSRLHILERWLGEVKPDFLFMQETKTQDEFFPRDFFDSLGYESFYRGQKSYNGVAGIVKKSITNINVNFGLDDGIENNFDTRVMTLRHGDLTILNTYVPQGKSIEHPDFDVKKKFFARVRNIIEANKEKKFLWLGDLNVAPEDIDVTSPENKRDHVCFCDEIREVFNETRKNLVDVLRMFDKNPGVFTFFDYRVKNAVEKNIGWRIDHMLASEKLSRTASKCYPDTRPRQWEKPSDHVPLVAEFAL